MGARLCLAAGTPQGGLVLSNAGTGGLADALGRMDAISRVRGANTGSRLAAGLNPTAVRAQLASHGLPAPDEIVAWFTWHNGSLEYATGRPTLQPIGLDAVSLEIGLANRQTSLAVSDDIQRMLKADGVARQNAADTVWRPGWLPIAETGGGDFLVVDLNSGSDELTTYITSRDWGEESTVPVTPSLADLVESWIEVIGMSTWSSDQERWEFDPKALPARLRRPVMW